MLHYCDYIAAQAKAGIEKDPDCLIDKAGPVKLDLHPTEGYLQSSKKTVEVTDAQGLRYRVTVEAIEA